MALHRLDLRTGRLIGIDCGGPDMDEPLLSYMRDYHRIDPRRARALHLGAAGLDRWQYDEDCLDAGFVRRHPFFQHWQVAYAMRHKAALAFELEGDTAVAFCLELQAGRGPLDADEREWARRLGEHVRDALRAHRRVRALLSQALAGHRLLSSFPYPMWLIGADRDVVSANAAAVLETDASTRVARRGRHLTLVRDRADRQLGEHRSTVSMCCRETSCGTPHRS